MVTKTDLQRVLKDELARFVTKDDLERTIARVERTIKSNHTINTHHYLETRGMVYDLNRKFDKLRQGLAQTAKPA